MLTLVVLLRPTAAAAVAAGVPVRKPLASPLLLLMLTLVVLLRPTAAAAAAAAQLPKPSSLSSPLDLVVLLQEPMTARGPHCALKMGWTVGQEKERLQIGCALVGESHESAADTGIQRLLVLLMRLLLVLLPLLPSPLVMLLFELLLLLLLALNFLAHPLQKYLKMGEMSEQHQQAPRLVHSFGPGLAAESPSLAADRSPLSAAAAAVDSTPAAVAAVSSTPAVVAAVAAAVAAESKTPAPGMTDIAAGAADGTVVQDRSLLGMSHALNCCCCCCCCCDEGPASEIQGVLIQQ